MNDPWYTYCGIVQRSWYNLPQNNHLTVWIEILGHHVRTYITGMVNSMMSIDQCMTHLLKMVQVLSHTVVHPQVYVDLIHNVCSIREYQSGLKHTGWALRAIRRLGTGTADYLGK